MTRQIRIFALSLLAGVLLLSLDARLTGVRADDADDCFKGKGDIAIRGCSALIEAKRSSSNPIAKGILANLYVKRGGLYHEKGDYDRAIADYTQAITLRPDKSYAFTKRGIAYEKKGDDDRAIADYTKAIALSQKIKDAHNRAVMGSEAYFWRGVAYEKKRDYDRAIADYSEAIRLNRKNIKALLRRASAYYFKGSYEHALVDYSLGILDLGRQETLAVLNNRKPPGSNNTVLTEALILRGATFHKLKDYDSAIKDFDSAIKRQPDNKRAYGLRALAYKEIGQQEKAIADLRKALALDPQDKQIKDMLAAFGVVP